MCTHNVREIIYHFGLCVRNKFGVSGAHLFLIRSTNYARKKYSASVQLYNFYCNNVQETHLAVISWWWKKSFENDLNNVTRYAWLLYYEVRWQRNIFWFVCRFRYYNMLINILNGTRKSGNLTLKNTSLGKRKKNRNACLILGYPVGC